MRRKTEPHPGWQRRCPCGVPERTRPEFHRATYCCDCPHHDPEYCPACVLGFVLVAETEQYLAQVSPN